MAILLMNCFTLREPFHADSYIYNKIRARGKSLTRPSVVQLKLVLSDFQLSSG